MEGSHSPASDFARPGMLAEPAPQDPLRRGGARSEPPGSRRALRRRFTAEYKLDFLRRAEAAIAAGKGKLGRLLRREGLRSSTLALWRKQRGSGKLKESRRGRPPMDRTRLMKENDRLRRKLAYFEECLGEAEALAWPDGKHGQPALALKGLAVKKRILDLADLALVGRAMRPEPSALPRLRNASGAR